MKCAAWALALVVIIGLDDRANTSALQTEPVNVR
jgi:hypothetical protein